jgi:lipoyl-dependent peroxiredoxin
MALAERRATVAWQGGLRDGSGTLEVASGAFPAQTLTFAARSEGADGKTSPEELIAAAHATCYAMAFSNTLANDGGQAPERLDITAVCTLDRIEGGLKITTMHLTVRGRVAGMDNAKFAELAKTAEQRCPVSNALRNNVQISVDAALA